MAQGKCEQRRSHFPVRFFRVRTRKRHIVQVILGRLGDHRVWQAHAIGESAVRLFYYLMVANCTSEKNHLPKTLPAADITRAQSQGWRRNVGSVTMEEFACNWITYTLLQTHVDVKLSIFHAKAASRIFRARPIESQGIRFGRQKTRNIGECGRPAAFALSIEFRSPLPFVQVRTDPRQRQK